ncbi:acyl-CoA/acyl-ACP dehydrogenase [Pseudonocardia kujensis]|uniref:acyl-CoA dehydrogenase family protein n=1 Tax=Pseudonocardia kujensis TaxID=1128675 RepID=UPI001E4D7CB2|nr:acyl-CoA dehydrogenase family protein [Pseudonocardia kujensis]MCE0761954.1 acyl-CoA/acyl-ACP dehydrogenase [Pseudonocardia kujensis]
MRWELSDEQADFRDVLADWLGETCASETLRGWLDSGDHAAFEERFVAEGWFGVGTPEDLGGEGGGLVELALAAEELGRRAAPAAAWLGSMLALPALAGMPEAAKALLADGITTVLTVPAGAVPGAATGVVAREGRLVGSIPAVLAADRAQRLVVPVAGDHGTVLELVEVAQPGVVVHGRGLTDRSRTVADVELDGALGTAIPVHDVADVLDSAALRAAVLVAADSLGVMEQMLDATVDYVQQRKQFGVPIGSFQAVKHAAAEMLVKVEAGRSIVYLAAASVGSAHEDAPLHAAAAKAQVCAAASAAADSALTLHGAIGYTWEHDLQIFYKRAKLDAELFGSPAAWNDRLARRLALLPTP